MKIPNGQWTEFICDVAAVSGVHAVKLNFQVQGDGACVIPASDSTNLSKSYTLRFNSSDWRFSFSF